MPKIKLDCPYFVWRDGRPRWVPGPKLRSAGHRGRDLRDENGAWLPYEAAIAAAREINAAIAGNAAGSVASAVTPPPRPSGNRTGRARTVSDLLEAFFAGADFARLRPNTQRDYAGKARAIRLDRDGGPEAFAAASAFAIEPPEVKAFFLYLERTRGLGMARGAVMVLSAAFAWARTSTDWRIRVNPCHRLGLPSPAPRIRIALPLEVRALVDAADHAGLPSIGDAIYLALFSGQREGDIIALERMAGDSIVLRQAKTGAAVKIFKAPQLELRLAAAADRRRGGTVVPADRHTGPVIVCETTGKPWGQSAFQHKFAEIRALAIAGVVDAAATATAAAGGRNEPVWLLEPCPSLATLKPRFEFRDFRDTAVTWIARAGGTLPEIADVTGHSLASITEILKHYLELDGSLARSAIDKLVAHLEREGIAL